MWRVVFERAFSFLTNKPTLFANRWLFRRDRRIKGIKDSKAPNAPNDITRARVWVYFCMSSFTVPAPVM